MCVSRWDQWGLLLFGLTIKYTCTCTGTGTCTCTGTSSEERGADYKKCSSTDKLLRLIIRTTNHLTYLHFHVILKWHWRKSIYNVM